MWVLLVEDDPMIGTAVEAALQDAAYVVGWVRSGQAALDAAAHQYYDLLLLDLGLPGKDGHVMLGSLRARGNPVPMLILIARDAVDERARDLDDGADDYTLKPLEMAELLARMRAVLCRKGGAASPVLTNGVLTLDPVAHEACMGDARPVRLSARKLVLL